MEVSLSRYWDLLADHIRPQRGRFTLLTVLLLSAICLQVVNPQVVRYFIDSATSGQSDEGLLAAGLAFIGIALLQQVVSVSATYLGENVAWTATNLLRAELARHCLRLDMRFHNDTSPGELIERIDGDVTQLSNFFSQLVIRVLGNILLMVGILAALWLEDWRVGVAFVVFEISTLYGLNRVRNLAVPHQKALRAAAADLFGYLEEQLAGTEDIRSSGAVQYAINGLYGLHTRILQHWRRAARMNLVVHGTAGLLLAFGTSIAFVSGYWLLQSGAITLGTAYLIFHYTNLFRRPVRELTQQVENLQNIGASTERLADLRAIESGIEQGSGLAIPTGSLPVCFERVSFAYNSEDPVLQEIDLQLAPGTVLGLLGRTGSGKTTLARLVFRLWDTTAGSVTLGDVDIRGAELAQLRQRVAMVTQQVQLFQASVRDNLTFFDRSIPDAEIIAAIEALELADWYRSLPKGLDTRLESGGRGLSAGEAQLLAFTRVLLRDPGLIILDEASSRLDPATERRIERAVDRLIYAPRRTAIIIAHRLGTVQRADEIMILEGGRVLEHGDRRSLAADRASHFYRLLETGLEEMLV